MNKIPLIDADLRWTDDKTTNEIFVVNRKQHLIKRDLRHYSSNFGAPETKYTEHFSDAERHAYLLTAGLSAHLIYGIPLKKVMKALRTVEGFDDLFESVGMIDFNGR